MDINQNSLLMKVISTTDGGSSSSHSDQSVGTFSLRARRRGNASETSKKPDRGERGSSIKYSASDGNLHMRFLRANRHQPCFNDDNDHFSLRSDRTDKTYSKLKKFSELSPWLEHCRDPIALEKRANAIGKPSYGHKNHVHLSYDPMQYVHLFEEEEKIINPPPSKHIAFPSANNMKTAPKLPGSGPLFGANIDMDLVSNQFTSFFQSLISTIDSSKGGDVKKQGIILGKLDEILSPTSKHQLPTCQSFPQDVLKIVRLLPGNDKCSDCGSRGQSVYGSPTYGTLMCKDCAYRHVTTSSQSQGKVVVISVEDGSWNLPNIIAMIEGGNQAIINYVGKNDTQTKRQQRRSSEHETQRMGRRGSLLASSIEVQPPPKRKSLYNTATGDDSFSSDFERVYASKAATSYRKMLLDRTRSIMLEKVLDGG